jgi:ketosteroid isomerase-like protein
MRITRRHLTIAGALALGGVGLWRSSSVVAESADEAAVAQAVEALRKAVFGQDKPQLEALCAEQLSYGHSDGRVETKAQFINGVMTRKAILKSLTLSDHTIAIVGADAIARHMLAAESETDGKPTSTKIGVLQVWQKQGGDWKLLVRQSFRPPQAQAS